MEAQEAKEKEKEKNGGKRKSVVEMLQEKKDNPTAKKAKKVGYQLEPEIADLIEKDGLNRKLWDECKESLNDTKQVMQFFHFVTISTLTIVFLFRNLYLKLKSGSCVYAAKISFANQLLPIARTIFVLLVCKDLLKPTFTHVPAVVMN